tara:strand:- start:1414 stop:1818 length:405 start_codon:yes stop_codon:yes gene_type:complete
MKIVKNKDFERDDSVKRHDNPDSPLRFPMHAQWTETHEERINWLYYENKVILNEYISAKLLYDIAKVRLQEKDKGTSLREYKVTREALAIWDEVNKTAEENHQKYIESFSEWIDKYHVIGRDEEWELGEEKGDE